MYDLETGTLKNTVTQGNWLVRHIVEVDIQRREVCVQTSGRNSQFDPYYKDLCRVNLDTGEITSLVSSDNEIYMTMQSEMQTMLLAGWHP